MEEEFKETQPHRFGGVEKLKTAQTCGIRSAPRSPITAYLDLYMLLKKREALERRGTSQAGQGDAYEQQLRDVLKQVKQLEGSKPELKELREAAEAEGKGKQAAKKSPKEGLKDWKGKDWKVVDIEY